MPGRIERSTVLFAIGMTFYWPMLHIDFFALLSLYTPADTSSEASSLLIVLAGMLVLCLVAFLARKSVTRLRLPQLLVVVVVAISVAVNLAVYCTNLFLPNQDVLLPWCLILGFAGVIALTYAWMSSLPKAKMQQVFFWLALSLSLSFTVSLPTTFFPQISWLFFSIVSALSALFWVLYFRCHTTQTTSSQLFPERFSYSNLLKILLIIALLLGSILRVVIASDEETSTSALGNMSLVRVIVLFVCSIIIVSIIRLVQRYERVLSISLSILLALFFAELLIEATLAQSAFATEIATILIIASISLLSFFLWVLLACTPTGKSIAFAMTSCVIYLLVEKVCHFFFRSVTLAADTFNVPLVNNIGVISLAMALMLVAIGLVIFNLLGLSRASRNVQNPPDNQAVLQRAKATYQLTDRETEVLELIIQGRSYRNIGEILYISESTVNTHTKNLYRKLGVHTKQEIIDMFTVQPR